MSHLTRALVSGLILLTGAAALPAADAKSEKEKEEAAKLAAQKKSAETNWASLDAGEAIVEETPKLVIFASKAFDKKTKDIAALLDKAFDKARSALGMDPKDSPWSGKLTVYLVSEREHFTAFVRRVEKRRLEAGEVGSYDIDRDAPHVIAGPPRTRTDPPTEAQAAQQIASALLQKKAGTKVLLPGWLVLGFGRATYYRVAPVSDVGVKTERAKAWELVNKQKRTASDVWNDSLDLEEAIPLGASLAEFFAYGPGEKRFPRFVEGFKPEENQERRTTAQAMEAADMKADAVHKSWQAWVPKGK